MSVNRDSLGEGIIQDVSLPSELRRFTLRILIGPKVFLVNHTNGDLEAKTGMTCVGFLKGKWADNKPEEASEKSVMAKLANSRTVVPLDRQPKTIGELVDDLRRTRGETRIRYHK